MQKNKNFWIAVAVIVISIIFISYKASIINPIQVGGIAETICTCEKEYQPILKNILGEVIGCFKVIKIEKVSAQEATYQFETKDAICTKS